MSPAASKQKGCTSVSWCESDRTTGKLPWHSLILSHEQHAVPYCRERICWGPAVWCIFCFHYMLFWVQSKEGRWSCTVEFSSQFTIGAVTYATAVTMAAYSFSKIMSSNRPVYLAVLWPESVWTFLMLTCPLTADSFSESFLLQKLTSKGCLVVAFSRLGTPVVFHSSLGCIHFLSPSWWIYE